MSAVVAPPQVPLVVIGSRRRKPEWTRSLLLDHATNTTIATAAAAAAAAAGYMKMEKSRQLFLRSYHFSRKKSGMEKLRSSAVRLRRLLWVRVRAVRRLPFLFWFRLRSCTWYGNWRRMRRRRQRQRQQQRMKFHYHFHFHPLGGSP